MSKKKLVVHIARTSLAGAPIRIVNALNKYSEYSARLINFTPAKTSDGALVYEEDLHWNVDKDEALDLIKNADIIHFHHWFDLKFNPFLIDFFAITKPNCKMMRHFHSDRYFLSKTEIKFDEMYKKDKLPKVVIPHYPERTFMDLPILPNIMPIKDEEYLPKEINNEKVKVVYSASQSRSMYEFRWATKGYEQVSKKLKELSERFNFEYIEISGKTFKEAMSLKRDSDIVVGDIVTGSYHLTELEGLSQGKPVLTWLDGRSVSTFMNTFKSKNIPFVNVNLSEIEDVLKELVENKDLRKHIGEYSRNWIEQSYKEEVLIKEFSRVYSELLKTGTIKTRVNCEKFVEAKEFINNRLYDIKWETRCRERLF